MPKVRDIVSYFSTLVPPDMKMDFDNVGLLVGINDAEVSRALVALDITDDVIDEAIQQNAQIILSHHPMFFELHQVNDATLSGKKIIKMLRYGISGFCQHTNLDAVPGGVNDALATALGVHAEGYLDGPKLNSAGISYGMGRYGHLSAYVGFSDFLMTVKTAINAAGLRYHDAGRLVHKVALCGGSGGNFVEEAHRLGCDTLVTADVKYDRFLAAKELGLNLIDADHFSTENVIVPVIAKHLNEGFPEIGVIIAGSAQPTAMFF